MNPLFRRWLSRGFALTLAAGLAGPAYAQRDLLGDARRNQELATQKAEADVQSAIRESRSMSAAEAALTLKRILGDVDSNTTIEPSRREALVRSLKDRIRILEASVRSSGGSQIPPATKETRKGADKENAEKAAADREKIRSSIAEINQLLGAGRSQEAERQANDLARQFPDHPAAQAMGRNAFINSRIREARQILSEIDRRERDVLGKEITKSATPIAGDIEFDKQRWADITKLRKVNLLTDKEKTLLKALNSPIEANWRGVRFEDVMDRMSTASGQVIIVDKKGLDEQSVTYDTPVTFVAPRMVSFRTALRKVLADQGLTYVVKDEVIYVTSATKAREMMTTRTYPIGDLVSANMFADGTKFHPLVTAQAEAETAKIIVDMIKEQIDPMSWQGSSGQGSVSYSPIAKALIVRQSAEVHMLLKGSFGK